MHVPVLSWPCSYPRGCSHQLEALNRENRVSLVHLVVYIESLRCRKKEALQVYSKETSFLPFSLDGADRMRLRRMGCAVCGNPRRNI